MKTIDPDFSFEIAEYDVIEFVLHDNATNKIELNLEMNALGLSLDDITSGWDHKWLPYDDKSDWAPETLYTSTLAEKKLGGLVWWPVFGCPSKPCDNTNINYSNGFTETEVALNKNAFYRRFRLSQDIADNTRQFREKEADLFSLCDRDRQNRRPAYYIYYGQ